MVTKKYPQFVTSRLFSFCNFKNVKKSYGFWKIKKFIWKEKIGYKRFGIIIIQRKSLFHIFNMVDFLLFFLKISVKSRSNEIQIKENFCQKVYV